MSHSYWMTTPEWLGETAFVLGCGPSLRDLEPRLLKGRRVIATNDSWEKVPDAEVLYFCDLEWWKANRDKVMDGFRGRKIVTMDNLIHGVKTLHCTGMIGLETDPGAVRHGSNSGYQAIHLAYHLGATRIILLGMDMRVDGDSLHWQKRQGVQTPEGFSKTLTYSMLPKFDSLAVPLRAAGVEVINCTPGSALRVWPIRPLREVLNGGYHD